MCIYPKKYNKKNFIIFLKKNGVSNEIIAKFVLLPKTIIHNGFKFKLDINTTWYNIDNTYYHFELNYYSIDCIEYLFSPKVFNDVEISINNLNYELLNIEKHKKI